jgi:hypothetical protein
MPYILKVDWTGYRTQAVIDALSAYPVLTRQLRLYVDPEQLGEMTTIKVYWTERQLGTAVERLAYWLGTSDLLAVRARDGDGDYEAVVAMQGQVHAALRDIITYMNATGQAGDHGDSGPQGGEEVINHDTVREQAGEDA